VKSGVTFHRVKRLDGRVCLMMLHMPGDLYESDFTIVTSCDPDEIGKTVPYESVTYDAPATCFICVAAGIPK